MHCTSTDLDRSDARTAAHNAKVPRRNDNGRVQDVAALKQYLCRSRTCCGTCLRGHSRAQLTHVREQFDLLGTAQKPRADFLDLVLSMTPFLCRDAARVWLGVGDKAYKNAAARVQSGTAFQHGMITYRSENAPVNSTGAVIALSQGSPQLSSLNLWYCEQITEACVIALSRGRPQISVYDF